MMGLLAELLRGGARKYMALLERAGGSYKTQDQDAYLLLGP